MIKFLFIISICNFSLLYSESRYDLEFVVVEKNNKYGYINKMRQVIIPFIYEGRNNFSKGLAVVTKYDENGVIRVGVIDKTGKEIVPLIYDNVDILSERLVRIKIDNKWNGLINATGKEVTSFAYEHIFSASLFSSLLPSIIIHI